MFLAPIEALVVVTLNKLRYNKRNTGGMIFYNGGPGLVMGKKMEERVACC